MARASNTAVDYGKLVNTSGTQRMLAHKVVMYLAVAAGSESDSERVELKARVLESLSTLKGNTKSITQGFLSMQSADNDADTPSNTANLEQQYPVISEFEQRADALIERMSNGMTLAHAELGSLADLVSGPLSVAFDDLKKSFYKRYRHDRDKQAQSMNESMEFLSRTLINVESISARIKMISLNAAVEAARLGQNGAAFAVIATAVRNLSIETENAVTSMRDTLALHRSTGSDT